MAPISSAGSIIIPAAQPTRRQAEQPVQATEKEKVNKQEQQLQGAGDKQGRGTSEQVSALRDNSTSPSVTQSDTVTSEQKSQTEKQQAAGERQEIEAAQQEAERAEFDQQADTVSKQQPNDVRPSSNNAPDEAEVTQIVAQEKENPAIKVFDQLQNINAAPRQGQSLNQFI